MHFLAVLCLSIIAGSNVANATDNPDGLFLRKTVTTSPAADVSYLCMVTNLFPAGMVGLVMAVLTAALVSTIGGSLNGLSTVVIMDIYGKDAPTTETTDAE